MMEKQFANFATLNDFGAVVQGSRATLSDNTPIDLVEGMNLTVNKINDVDTKNKKIILIGNGGSAAIASHQATDLWKNGGIRALAFNDASLLTCAANDFGYEQVFSQPVARFADPGDLLIAISSSGKSANILNGVKAAKEMGCTVVTFSGFLPDNPLRKQGEINFYLASNSYGIVEVGHLLMLHGIIDEVVLGKKGS